MIQGRYTINIGVYQQISPLRVFKEAESFVLCNEDYIPSSLLVIKKNTKTPQISV